MSEILTGDCVELMATLDADSVDAIVTDPPYGLEFMGREWDRLGAETVDAVAQGGFQDGNGGNAYSRSRVRFGGGAKTMQEWHQRWATEAFRVAKPGAHLLAFGGTRTYHRLASAIEDAGWEIRDCLVWAYCSGFPKSLNVAKQPGVCHCGTVSPTEHDLLNLRNSDVPPPEPDGAVLLSPLSEQGARVRGTDGADTASPQAALWASEPGLEGRGDVLQDARQLRRGQVRSGSAVGAADGPEGRVHHGASLDRGSSGGSAPESNGSGESHRPRPDQQRAGEPGTVADERRPQAGRGWPSCDRCGKPQVAGTGTALKPAWEPIVMARKPLVGTVAANVLRHGTGALNIDATRIGTDGGTTRRNGSNAGKARNTLHGGNFGVDSIDAGRWPANLILTDPIFDGGIASWMRMAAVPYADTGTYSRFFLIPKAARSDREPEYALSQGGLEQREWHGQLPANATKYERKDGTPGQNLPRANSHPTVKPVELMRHLVRLVTPPGGTVLDCFLGSGTTAIACEMEGFAWIGIEKEPEYVAIAEARLNGTQRGIPWG